MTAALLSPAARRDLLGAVRWIAQDNPSAARALRDALVRATVRIGEFPDQGSFRPELAEESYRFIALTGFPYIIIYNAARRPPLILRFLHGARDLPDILSGLQHK